MGLLAGWFPFLVGGLLRRPPIRRNKLGVKSRSRRAPATFPTTATSIILALYDGWPTQV